MTNIILSPLNDGVDHINVFSRAKTALGKKLTNFNRNYFVHPKYGKFASVEACWYFRLLLEHGIDSEEIKLTYGFAAKELGRKLLPVKDDDSAGNFSDDFKEDICEAIRCKLRQNKDILKELTYSTLPLVHYYYFGKDEQNAKIITVPQYDWIIEEISRIRQVMRSHLNLETSND